MSIGLTIALPCARLIAADRRYSKIGDRGGPNETCLAYSDHGGKLIRLAPEFWITSGGTTGPILPILEELVGADPREAWRVLRRAAVTMSAHEIPATILIASPQGVARVMRGCFDEPTHLGGHWGVAPGRENQATIDAEKADMESLFAYPDRVTLGVLLRRVCLFFARMAQLSPFVSPTMELAIYDYHLAGVAAELAALSEGELIRALWCSPRPPRANDVRAALEIMPYPTWTAATPHSLPLRECTG